MRSILYNLKYLTLLFFIASGSCSTHHSDMNWGTPQTKSKMEPVVQIGHSAPVTSVAFSACGRYVLSGSKDKTVKLWDIASGREIRTFKGHSDVVSAVAFSPKGRHIVSSSWDGTVRLWDIASGSEVSASDEHQYKVHALAVSRNGKYALSGSEDRSLILWHLPSCRVAKRFGGSTLKSHINRWGSIRPKDRDRVSLFAQSAAKAPGKNYFSQQYKKGHMESVISVDFSRRGTYALSGSQDFTMRLWDISSGDTVKTFKLPLVEFFSVALSPDGKYALSGNSDSVLRLWKISNRKLICELRGHSDAVSAVAFSPNSQYALSGSWDHTLTLWSVPSGDALKSFWGHSDKVNAVAFSPDGRYVLSGSDDHTLKLWDIATGQELRTFKGHSFGVSSSSISPDGRFLLSGHEDNTLKLWSITEGQQIKVYRGHLGIVHSVAFSSDGRLALSGSSDKAIILWDISTGQRLRIFTGHTGAVTSVSMSEDNRYVLSGSDDQTVKLWDFQTGDEIKSFTYHDSKIRCVALSPDGSFAVVGTDSKAFDLMEISTGRTDRTFKGHFYGVNTVSFSPDGRYVLSGGGDKLVKLWDISTGQLVRSFVGHSSSIHTATFTPDGRYVLSGSEDGTLTIWDVSKGLSIKTLAGHSDKVTSAAFTRDLRYVLSGSSDASLRKWDFTEGCEIVRMYGSADGEWITVTPDGYYQNSTEGNYLVHWSASGIFDTFSFEQFESHFKRPDLVKARLSGDLDIGKPAPQLTRPPHVEMKEHEAVKETSAKNYSLALRASALEQVRTVRVFVNGQPALEVPVNEKEKELSLDVPLFSGANRITAVAYDEKGFSSNPKYLDVISKSEEPAKSNLFIFAIGISNYPQLASGWQLEFAHTDSQAIVDAFSRQERKLFGEIRYNVLSNEKANVETIVEVVDALSATDENDMVVIFMAGHGVRARDGKFYFLTSDGSFEEPEKEGVSWSLLSEYLARIKGRVILLLDACHSGSIVNETVVPNEELAQQFFTGGHGGVMVFSASKGRQYSLESPDIAGGFGIFTYALIQALGPNAKEADTNSNDYVEFMELVDYVSKYVHKETKGEQTPWLSRKELFGDLPVAMVN